MRRKLRFPAFVLLGAAVLMFATSTAVGRGGGGGGGGHGGGGSHSGGFSGGGGSFHSGGGGSFHSGGGGSFHSGGGGNFHSGGFSSGGFHSGTFQGGTNTFSSHGNFGNFTGHGGTHFAPYSGTSFSRFAGVGGAMVPQGQRRHTQGWNDWGHGQAWYHGGYPYHHDYYRHHYGFAPFFFPGRSSWYGWPYYYDNAYYSYWPSYYGASGGAYLGSVSYAQPTETATVRDSMSQGQQYLEAARAEFRNGNYQAALRMAGHAAVEMPQTPAVHDLTSLSLFALKDYRSAAMEAHAALALGPPIDWSTLYAYYDNAETYTDQLRALEAFVRSNPKKAEGPFLLGYHYIMIGSKDYAKKQLTAALAMTPTDKLAEKLVEQLK